MLLWLLLLNELSFSMSHDYVYHFINESKSWCDAKRYCRKHYTDLATVNNMTDQKRLNQTPLGEEGAWIGLHNKTKDREWHWSQPGVKFNETEAEKRWEMGGNRRQPDDENGPENCVYVNKENLWHDCTCSAKLCFICYNGSSVVYSSNLSERTKNWTAAQHYCRQHHTDLISGPEQLRLISNTLNNEICDDGDNQWLIGLFRDTWGWSDGTHSSFRNWDQNDPHMNKNYIHDKMDCAKLGPQGQWIRDNCSLPSPFICYDKRFILVKLNKTWEEAMSYCRRYYRDLAWHSGQDQLRMVQERAKMADTEVVWVGLHFTCFFEEWIWVNGHWVSEDHPNWKHPGPGKCGDSGAMERGGGNKWVKRRLEEKHNFICAVNL